MKIDTVAVMNTEMDEDGDFDDDSRSYSATQTTSMSDQFVKGVRVVVLPVGTVRVYGLCACLICMSWRRRR
jgi:hypothetical protein